MLPLSNGAPASGGNPMQFTSRQPHPHPVEALSFKHNPIDVESFRQGYPRLAAFINCDKDFVIFRKFGVLQARVLLAKQDELITLEERLQSLDNSEANAYLLTTRRGDTTVERANVLGVIEKKLLEYHQLLSLYYGQIERQSPKTENIRSLSRWLNQNKPVVLEESKFLNDWDDLVAPVSSIDGGISSLIESVVAFLCKIGFGKLFIKMHWTSIDHRVILFNAPHVSVLSRGLTTFIACVTLTGPVVGLYFAKSLSTRLWIVAICTAVFSTLASVATRSRNIELFSATAAYCAVLVVFMGNL